MGLRESDVCDRAAAWLKAQGLRVFGEVAPRNMPARFDLVGLSGFEVVIVEAKTSFTKALRVQLEFAATCADRVYAALPSGVRTANVPPGFGVLIAKPEWEMAACVVSSMPSTTKVAGRAAIVRASCTRHHGERGGLTSAAGGARLSPYRILVFTVHERLVAATCCKRPAAIGEVLDLCGDLFAHVKNRRASLLGLLEREATTFRFDDGWWAQDGDPDVLHREAKQAAKVARERRASL